VAFYSEHVWISTYIIHDIRNRRRTAAGDYLKRPLWNAAFANATIGKRLGVRSIELKKKM
jgi:hypothetical protein